MIRFILAAALCCAPLIAHAAESSNNFLAGIRSLEVTLTRVPVGMASWYGAESGNRTSSGARFDPEGQTCAMRTHAWRWVTVTVLATGRSARCYVNDFGPAKKTGRLIDVSHGVARRLDILRAGVARVSVE
jgi:rare lipoprotein A